MRRKGHVAWMGKMRNKYKNFGPETWR